MFPTSHRRRYRTRRPFALLSILAAAVLTATACSGESGTATDRDVIGTLRIGVIGTTNLLSGPLGFAHSRGELIRTLKPLGVDSVEIFNFPNGPDLNQALIGGRLDVANYGDTPALVARGSGLQTKLLAITQYNNNAGVVVKNPAITSLKDLDGKRIGVPKGSYIDRYLQGALAEEGVKATLVHLYPADQEGPLNSGAIDAGALPDVIPSANLQNYLHKGFRLIDSAYRDHPGLAGTSVSVSSADFLAKHPDFTAAWQKLLGESVTYTKAHWDEYLAFESTVSKAPAEALRAAANPDGFSPDPYPAAGLKLLTGTKTFLVEQHSLKKDFDLDTWFAAPPTTDTGKEPQP